MLMGIKQNPPSTRQGFFLADGWLYTTRSLVSMSVETSLWA